MSDENDDALGLKLLAELDKADIDNTYEWAQKNNVDHDQLSSFIKSYWGRKIIEPKSLSLEFNLATDEGKQVAELGSAEFRVYNTIAESDGGISKADLMSKLEKSVAGNGIGAAMKNKWIRIDAGKYVADASKADEVRADAVAQLLRGDLDALDKPQQTLLKKRKLLKLTKITAFQVTKGEKFTTTPPKLAFDLTLDMINTGSWQTVEWKKHNFGGLGVRPAGGSLHPLLKARAEYRQIFLEMGFEEMRTNRWVESSFWNFDALFQPQQHPARDAHDTFFVGEPANGPEQHAPPTEYVEKVKCMHEQGGQGSIGYRYQWSLEEAKKNILRTHTTAVSTRTLYELAKDFEPKKFFSIDRVFRNEKMDATHLAEFHQIEGIIIGPDLTLGDLIGTIKQFFARVGVHRIKFKPAYNPYTEPSMEIFAHHPLLNKWVEIGNSGMFRPEMLLPMGFPPNIRAIAWGFGLERPVMIKYGISNIRDLVGHKLDLNFVKTNPLCRLDKD